MSTHIPNIRPKPDKVLTDIADGRDSRHSMQAQTDKKYSYLPLLITGVAVVLFSSAGIARMMGWGPDASRITLLSACSGFGNPADNFRITSL